MFRYILFRIWKKYQYHKLTYVLLVLEIVIGISFVTVALNCFFYGQRISQEEKDTQRNKELMLSVEHLDQMGDNFIPDREDILAIEEVFGEAAEFVIGVREIVNFETAVEDLYHVYTNKVKDENTIYVGEKISKWIDRDLISVEGNVGEIDTQVKKRLSKINENNEIDTEKMIVSSINHYFIKEDRGNFVSSFSTIYISKSKVSPKEMEKMLEYLKTKYEGEYKFYFSNINFQQQSQIDYFMLIPGYLGKAAVILLIVMIVGFTGIIELLFLKRKKGLAICAACGASYRTLHLEIIWEILGIVMFSGTLGLMIGNILTRLIDFGIPVPMNLHTVYSVVILMVIMVVIICAPYSYKLQTSSIYELIVNAGR